MNNGTCRIIGGRWRGRKITFDDAEGLRPTTDRIRETVFNWLQPFVNQSCCLDLFAGSGVLGFEALSRAAGEVVFVEQNKNTVKNLKQNAAALGANNLSILQRDAVRWLQAGNMPQKFNLVFLDPPFQSDLLTNISTLLSNSGCLAADAIIYVEHNNESDIVLPANWQLFKEKKAGQVAYKLFENRVVSERVVSENEE